VGTGPKAAARAARRRYRALRAKRYYREFVRPGDLVFDIGAHVGARTEVFLALGARVIAVEPQATFAALITQRAVIEALAVGATRGTVTLMLANGAPELATVSANWVESIRERFPRHPYTDAIEVPMETLDDLIERHGVPSFCKIDAEGHDAEVVRGLSTPLRAVQCEFAAEAADVPVELIRLLSLLGDYSFAISHGTSMKRSDWMTAESMTDVLRHLEHDAWGDLLARHQAMR
jgi:FkbM family methyltransferase